jgi:hypothetical protein
MTEQSARRTPSRRPVAPFNRADAIYFLASAGAFLGHVGVAPEHSSYSAGAVCEALATLGVSHQELKVATARGLTGQPSRWEEILDPEFLDNTVRKPQP